MKFDVITLFPDMFNALSHGITGRAIQQQLITLQTISLRQYATLPNGKIDDRPYGGGPGMVMQYAPIARAISDNRPPAPTRHAVLYLSPQGKRLTHQHVLQLATLEHITLLCGRYEDIDERVRLSMIDEEYSLGDFVLSGGEIAAMALIDTISRQIPGVLGHHASAAQDSFSDGLLDCPHYTRPEQIDGQAVPAVLLQGDHAAIARWRLQQSLGRTWQKRPDLLKSRTLTFEEQTLLDGYIQNISKLED